MERERRTVEAMIRIYCRNLHGTRDGLCHHCRELQEFAHFRLQRCPYQEEKPTCSNCPIHCYRPDRREEIKAVMRYAGPRMMRRHPVLAMLHLLDGRRPPPPLEKPSRTKE